MILLATEHDALVTWSAKRVADGLPAIRETIDPSWFAEDEIGTTDAWSLVCQFDPAVNEQGSPSRARVRFWVEDAPHHRLKAGAVLRLFERGTGQYARVEILD